MKTTVPTLQKVQADYYELYNLIKDVKTVEQAYEFEQENRDIIGEVEINGESIKEFIKNNTGEEIRWIRYDHYGCLDYIYAYTGNSQIFFDIVDSDGACFIDYVTVNQLTKENYDKWTKYYSMED